MPEPANPGGITLQTRSQKLAQRAAAAVQRRAGNGDYASYAKSFPALIHTCGLCQAVAFSQRKGKPKPGEGANEGANKKPQAQHLDDLVTVLAEPGIADATQLAEQSRVALVTEYLRLSRNALEAATWIKRYAEAFETTLPVQELDHA